MHGLEGAPDRAIVGAPQDDRHRCDGGRLLPGTGDRAQLGAVSVLPALVRNRIQHHHGERHASATESAPQLAERKVLQGASGIHGPWSPLGWSGEAMGDEDSDLALVPFLGEEVLERLAHAAIHPFLVERLAHVDPGALLGVCATNLVGIATVADPASDRELGLRRHRLRDRRDHLVQTGVLLDLVSVASGVLEAEAPDRAVAVHEDLQLGHLEVAVVRVWCVVWRRSEAGRIVVGSRKRIRCHVGVRSGPRVPVRGRGRNGAVGTGTSGALRRGAAPLRRRFVGGHWLFRSRTLAATRRHHECEHQRADEQSHPHPSSSASARPALKPDRSRWSRFSWKYCAGIHAG